MFKHVLSEKTKDELSVRKVDVAVSLVPLLDDNDDKDFKLYLFICEAKKPNFEQHNQDYDKLLR